MRQRKTWTSGRNASTQRQADDIYTMNRDGGNPQPAVDEYVNGDPSAWAEDVNSCSSVDKEYEGGVVKRNEIGLPEFRDDTWNSAGTRPWGKGGQYDNARLAAQRKAVACERVARAILRTDNEKLVHDTALDLMNLPTRSLVATVKRMNAASPAALPKNAMYRRSLACTKLAAILLTENADEDSITRLASLFGSIDDPTLKGMLHVVATSRVAEDEKKEEAKDEKKDDDKKESKSEKEEEGVLTDTDLDKLQSMMQETVEEVVEGGEEEAPESGTGDDLQNLFDGGEEEEKEETPAPTASTAGAPEIEILFDEEDEDEDEDEGQCAVASDLADLFADEQVMAQRDIRAAAGYGQRTASVKGAKKLGQVKKASVSVDESLESLWERPGK